MVFLILFTQATPTDFALFGVKKTPYKLHVHSLPICTIVVVSIYIKMFRCQ